MVPYVYFHKQQINSLNKTAHHILKNEIDLILPDLPTRKEKRGIFTLLTTCFLGIAYEGNFSFWHSQRHKASYKAVKVMETKINIQLNKPMHLEDSMVMYGVCNAETLEKHIKTVHSMHKTKTLHEALFAG